MIIDRLENISKYAALHPALARVADFVAGNALIDMEPGHHPIEGEDLFVNIQAVPGRTREEAQIEYHKLMIDVQVPLSAQETYAYLPMTGGTPRADFNATDDIGFLPDAEPQGYVTCEPGMFVVFFPEEGHAPLISDAKLLKKAIFKIKA